MSIQKFLDWLTQGLPADDTAWSLGDGFAVFCIGAGLLALGLIGLAFFLLYVAAPVTAALGAKAFLFWPVVSLLVGVLAARRNRNP